MQNMFQSSFKWPRSNTVSQNAMLDHSELKNKVLIAALKTILEQVALR